MLNNFLKINLPYGMLRNDEGKWLVFNREYKPIGFYSYEYVKYESMPIFVEYKGLTEKKILDICHDPNLVNRDKNGKIWRFWFYCDITNPVVNPTKRNIINYMNSLMKVSKLKTVDAPHRY